MTKFQELEQASTRLRDRQQNAEAAARQFIADCRWALADFLGINEDKVHFYGEKANSEFHWEDDELQFLLVLSAGGTEFRFRIRFKPDRASNGHVVSVAGSEYVQYPLHGGIWHLAETVFALMKRYFDNSNHVEPIITVANLTLSSDRPSSEGSNPYRPDLLNGPGAIVPK